MNCALNIATLVFLGCLFLPTPVLAKRTPAPSIAPIVHNGVRYTVPNDKGTRGYVVAWDAVTGKQLWTKTIFRKCICPCLEHDIQWVFIKEMRLEDGLLIIVNESRKVYSLDPQSRRVKRLRNRPEGRPTVETRLSRRESPTN